jgi:hypothetical protein
MLILLANSFQGVKAGGAVGGQAPKGGKAENLENPSSSATRHPPSLNFLDLAAEVPGYSALLEVRNIG